MWKLKINVIIIAINLQEKVLSARFLGVGCDPENSPCTMYIDLSKFLSKKGSIETGDLYYHFALIANTFST